MSDPRIFGLLSWYDERPDDLYAMAASLPKAGVTHLIALDGAYALYPQARAQSPEDNYTALREACQEHGLVLYATHPDVPWPGNETQKRTSLFRLAEEHTRPDDWYLIIDGDEEIIHAPHDLRTQLAQTPLDVAEVTFHEPEPSGPGKRFPIPILFRAIRGLSVVGNHYTYRTPDGRNLWGNAANHRLAPRHPTSVLVLHKTTQRAPARRGAALAYYRKRDKLHAELGSCDRCPRPATRTLHTNWRPSPDGYVADHAEACTLHALEIEQENRDTLYLYGLDPDTVKVEHRLGPAPA